MKSLDMPSTICLNRVIGTNRIEGFDDDNCHVGTGYIKANRVFMDTDNERQRQIERGYDAAHDDKQIYGQIGSRGGCLALAAPYQRGAFDIPDLLLQFVDAESPDSVFHGTDLGIDEFTDSRDMLVKAAALVVAEIERIDREVASE